jgi:hypothetical protein
VSKPAKNLLVYADGRVREIKQRLEGMWFIVPEDVKGDLWERKFEVNYARNGQDAKGTPSEFSLVGLECEFRLVETRAQRDKRAAEASARTMRAVLWGIRNYPGDDE